MGELGCEFSPNHLKSSHYNEINVMYLDMLTFQVHISFYQENYEMVGKGDVQKSLN